MKSRDIIAGIVSGLVKTDHREEFAGYIERGCDLSDIGQPERDVLARLVRGHSPRKPGQTFKSFKYAERKLEICCDVAKLMGYGLPAYSTSQELHKLPGYPEKVKDAAEFVAERWGLHWERVCVIWAERDEESEALAFYKEMGQHAKERDIPP